MSLEALLEKAYAGVLRQTEPSLADVPLRLNTDLLEQSPASGETGESASDGNEQVPVPSVTLTARSVKNDPPGSCAHEVELDIEARDNVAVGAGAMDRLALSAFRPLRIVNLPALLTGNSTAFRCFGMPHRGEGEQTSDAGSTVVRKMKGAFMCGAQEND